PSRVSSVARGVGAIFATIFGVIWLIFAASAGAPWPFVLFGFIFIAVAIGGAIFNFYNAMAQNRIGFYEITNDQENSAPLSGESSNHSNVQQNAFCPFCGAAVSSNFDYCPKCGKNIKGALSS